MSDRPTQTLEEAEEEMWSHLRLAPLGEPSPPTPIDIKQIIYALKRVEAQQRAHADQLSDRLDYSAEFPFEDAERIKEAITLLQAKPAIEPEGPSAAPAGLPYGIIDPDYAKAFTIARVVAWQYGYALTMHGSFTRDLDLVMLPWTERACEPKLVVNRIAYLTGLKLQGEPGAKPHGRLAWTLLFPGFGDPRWIDLSVVPRQEASGT